MLHAPEGPPFLATCPRRQQEPFRVSVDNNRVRYYKSHQTKRLCNQSPWAQELANDESSQDGLDLGDTTVLSMDGIFLHEQRRTVCEKDLSRHRVSTS